MCSSSQMCMTWLMIEEVRDIMARQQNPNVDIPEKKLEMLLNEHKNPNHIQPERHKQVHLSKVDTTKVPIHGTLWIDCKMEESMWFFLANVNGLSFYQ